MNDPIETAPPPGRSPAPACSGISFSAFKTLLVAHGLIDPCAYEDAEGYDGGYTYNRSMSAWAALCESISSNAKIRHDADSAAPQP